MDLDAYRQQTIAAMDSAAPPPPPPAAQPLLTQLADPQADPAARLTALHALLRLAFHELNFAPYRAQFLDCLAAIVADARADQRLRAEAIEKLSQEQHPIAAQILSAGISDPARALVPLAKAVQLLAIDDHGVAAAAAREAIRVSNDAAVWVEAMHALAGDASAAPLLEGVLADRNRPPAVRLASAVSLHALDPTRLLAQATSIVGDRGETDELRADMLSALSAARHAVNQPLDAGLNAIAQDLSQQGVAPLLRSAARRFLGLAPEP